MGGGVTQPRSSGQREAAEEGSDIIAGGGAAQLPPTRGIPRVEKNRRLSVREWYLLPLEQGLENPLRFQPPPTATCRCRRDLLPPTRVVAAPAPVRT